MERSTLLDARREPRFKVHWRARVQLPSGQDVELRVRDISESGMGLVGGEAVPPAATLTIRVRVPDLGDPAQTIEVVGTAMVAHVAMRGYEFAIGMTWVDRSDAGRELMSRWIRKLRLGY